MSWSVSATAKRHVASQRLFELSVPKERKALAEGHDPYMVSQAARSARLSAAALPAAVPQMQLEIRNIHFPKVIFSPCKLITN